jgi:phage baseplate assembly protein W
MAIDLDRLLGSDLSVVPHFVAHDASEVDFVRVRRPIRGILAGDATEAFDLAPVAGRSNLAQALILRMLTARGSLAALGHTAYGSRLHKLIGQRKTETLRNLCRAFVLEIVAQEPRVENKAVALVFDPQAETASSFVFTLAVQPLQDAETLSLSLEVGL